MPRPSTALEIECPGNATYPSFERGARADPFTGHCKISLRRGWALHRYADAVSFWGACRGLLIEDEVLLLMLLMLQMVSV